MNTARGGDMDPAKRTRSLARNLSLLVAFQALQMALFPVAIVTLYMNGELGLSMADVFVLQAWFGLCTALLEVPGGLLADRIGYRRSMIAAALCGVSGWSVYVFAVGFYSVAAAELILALSLALSSGTDAALMYESLKELDSEHEFTRWFARSRSLGAVSEGSAALAAGLLYASWPRSPFVVQVGVWLLAAVACALLVEPARRTARDGHPYRRIQAIVHYAAIAQPRLRASLLCYVALGLGSFIPVWMIAPYAVRSGVPVASIGVIWAAANYSVALGHWLAPALERRLGAHALFVVVAAYLLGYLGLGGTDVLFGFAFYYAICLGRGLNGPVLSHLQQRLIPSSDRASLLSLNSVLFRLSFAAIGPAIGWGVDRHGYHTVLLVIAGVLLPVCAAAIAWYLRSPAFAVPSVLEPELPEHRPG